MSTDRTAMLTPAVFQELLGYLNFSSGNSDPKFLRNLNELFTACHRQDDETRGAWQSAGQLLRQRLQELAHCEPAFADVEQAQAVLRLAFEVLPGRYREFHRDLLQHHRDEDLLRPFFMARVCEAVLQQGGPWDEPQRIVSAAVAHLNDFIGYRPVAVLQTEQRIEPYAHEWVRPIPLYVRAAGVATGRYQAVVEIALDILRATDEAILRDAFFDPELVDELALDPRAYDFDHPVNKRPNYHFGQWDPHHIDNQGHYRRFVVQQVTLDVLLQRVVDDGEFPREQLLVEAAAVLAGTILMASGTSGSGPDSHDSTTTLSTLLPRIAAYRDAFYKRFIQSLAGKHGRRLREEAVAGKQPLAGARQHLNQQLARRRATQLAHVHLAGLFARMGYSQAAIRQAEVVPVASARMTAEIQCRLTAGHLAIDAGDLPPASAMLSEAEDFLHRAIECGAVVDPWNILGFQGQFSLYPAPENSVPDHRLEQLIDVVDAILGLYSRLWSEAAARDNAALQTALAERMKNLTEWWDQFAPTSVESIEAFSGNEAYESAREVAGALAAFHRAGAAAGDIAFWRSRVEQFKSPKAYALVVGALFEKPDLLAAMALLMQWLSQAQLIGLRQGDYSFFALVRRWLEEVCSGTSLGLTSAPAARSSLVVRFFELLEANGEDYWQVPPLELLDSPHNGTGDQWDDLGDVAAEDEDDEDNPSGLYSAAYDDMVYIDSTSDGVEADMLESGPAPASDFELEQEARRLGERLALAQTMATLWKQAAISFGPKTAEPLSDEALGRWLAQATDNQRRLTTLLGSVHLRRVPAPSTSRDSLLEFDRRRAVKDALIEKILATLIDTVDASRMMRAARSTTDEQHDTESDQLLDDVLRAVVRHDRVQVQRLWPRLLDFLQSQTLLYLPATKGGDAARLVRARALHELLRDLLAWLPKLGLLKETCQLLETARLMESSNPVGPGAISEYDRLFSAGYESLAEAIVVMSQDWTAVNDADADDNQLVECLENLTESLLKQWLAHSRTLRLSVLERIADDKAWEDLRQFIERYGGDLFTQRFLNMGNLRAILHEGVDTWLDQLVEDDRRDEYDFRLLDDFGESLSPTDATWSLTLVIEAILENYTEYRDYNSTTTQSDSGEMLYTLLDFLRLRVQYDRVAWHLKPVLIAHAVLVRRGRTAAAETWRRAMAQRTEELADKLQRTGDELRKKYAMRLPTVTDRLAERFVQPLAIDRVRALVKPAMDDVRSGAAPSTASFEFLQQEIDELAQQPTGIGLEVPNWLAALEDEVAHHSRAAANPDSGPDTRPPLDQIGLSQEEVQRQLTDWERNSH